MSFNADHDDADTLPREVNTESEKHSADRVHGVRLTVHNIRLLQLATASANAPLECRLIEVSIDNLPPYEALSYVWGDAGITEPIECNGEIIQITTNLAKALRRVRAGISKPRSMKDTSDVGKADRWSSYINVPRVTGMSPRSLLLWVDAICINQADIIERNLQVPLMSVIYSKAQRVVVWLGDAAIHADQTAAVIVVAEVFELVLFGQASYERPDASQLDFTHRDLMQLMSHRGYTVQEEVWAAVSILFASTWFTRIWCVQEIILARDATLLFEFEEFKLHVIQALAQWLVDLCLTHQIAPPHVRDALTNITEARNRLAQANHNVSDILAFINVYSRLSATDPRDKIYGLLGLTDRKMIEVDYAKSTLEVYSSFVLSMLDRGLQILSHAYHPVEYDRSDAFPSWVPRFDRKSNKARFYDFPRDNELSRQRPRPGVCPALTVTGNLRFSGLRCDTVSVTDYIRFDPESLIYGRVVNTGQKFLDYLVDLWFETQPVNAAGNFTDLTHAYSLGLNLTGGHLDFYTMVDDSEKADQFEFLRCFLAFMKQLIRSGLDWIDLEGADMNNSIRLMTLYCNDRRIFRTNKGWMGLGPRCMRPDDLLVVLDGGPMPYILRPADAGKFLFMGDCYVSNIARGEVYRLIGTDGIEEGVFELI